MRENSADISSGFFVPRTAHSVPPFDAPAAILFFFSCDYSEAARLFRAQS
jgi:hypothetical protein